MNRAAAENGQTFDDHPEQTLTVLRRFIPDDQRSNRLLAFTFPTSQLSNLIQIIENNQLGDDFHQAAESLLSFRLHRRLALPIWQRFQCEPDRSDWQRLLVLCARQFSPDRDPFLALIPREPGDFAVALMQNALTAGLRQTDTTNWILGCQIDAKTLWGRDLSRSLILAGDRNWLKANTGMVINYLESVSNEAACIPAVDHYLKAMRPVQIEGEIGRKIQQSERLNQLNLYSPEAASHWKAWLIIASFSAAGLTERARDLLKRHYYVMIDPCYAIGQNWLVVKLSALHLLIDLTNESLYVYPDRLFHQTYNVWQHLVSFQQTSNESEGMEQKSEITWTIDFSMVQTARDLILAEQNKKAEELTWIEELVSGKKKSIIQLSLDDAHYLYARKFFDDLATFQGLAEPD